MCGHTDKNQGQLEGVEGPHALALSAPQAQPSVHQVQVQGAAAPAGRAQQMQVRGACRDMVALEQGSPGDDG